MPAARPAAGEAAAVLAGAAPEAVIARFGEPLLRRQEGDAEIWLYAGAGCHLDIVFYPAEDAGAPRVAHAATRADAPGSDAACLAALTRRPA
jgi:hypothetical protein